jgi:hypothetical protein
VSSFVDLVGQFIQHVIDAGAGAVASVVHTANSIVPGGFPVFVVMCVIAVLVGLATFRR